MPNIITHILFTDDVYEKLDDPKYDFLESRLQLMEVGGNGPDFLFFHNLNPTSFMKKTPLRKMKFIRTLLMIFMQALLLPFKKKKIQKFVKI